LSFDDCRFSLVLCCCSLVSGPLSSVVGRWSLVVGGWGGGGGGTVVKFSYSSPGTVGGQLGILKHWLLGQAQHRILIPGFLKCVLLWTDSEMQLNVLM